LFREKFRARKAANITQKQLAEKTGIAQSDISKIENGNANPAPDFNAQEIKSVRNTLQMTQATFAAVMGVSTKTGYLHGTLFFQFFCFFAFNSLFNLVTYSIVVSYVGR